MLDIVHMAQKKERGKTVTCDPSAKCKLKGERFNRWWYPEIFGLILLQYYWIINKDSGGQTMHNHNIMSMRMFHSKRKNQPANRWYNRGLTDFGSIDIPDNDPPIILKDTCSHMSWNKMFFHKAI